MFKLKPVALALLATSSSTYAYAQENVDQEAQEEERIVVTGSRIARPGVETVSPVVSLDVEDLAITGNMNVAQVLATLPQFAVGIEASDNSYNPGNAGLATANLRDLGSHRTLVLINGHRPTQMVDSGGRLVSDLQNIPASLIQNIEVLTGGASAVYGSDAVAGVVNVILKKDFEGFNANLQGFSTEEKDGESQSLSLSYGANFNDNKGNVVFSLDYYNQEELTYASRPGSNGQTAYIDNPNGDIPNQVILHNVGWADYNIPSNRPTFMSGSSYDYFQFDRNSDGTLGEGYRAILDSELHEYYMQSHDLNPNMYSSVGPQQAMQPYTRLNLNLHGGYELADDIYLTADVNYSRVETEHTIDPEFVFSWNGWVNVYDAPFEVPQVVIDAAESDGTSWIAIPYTFNDLGNRIGEVDREYVSVSFALDGDFDNGWSWDAYIAGGKTTVDETSLNRLNTERWDNFVLFGECEATNSCAVMNPFEPLTQEVIDYIKLDPFTDTSETYQYTLAANISGDVLELPAGELMFSAGFEIRKEGLEVSPSQVSLEGTNRGNTRGATDVDRDIQEVYIEFIAPIVTDAVMVKSLEVEAAYRYANYTYAGSNNSWKLGANWAIDDNLRIRTNYSKAVRAPQLTELFRPEEVVFARYIDPCDSDELDEAVDENLRRANCAALGLPADFESEMRITGGSYITVKGNEDLNVETAHTLTAGFVFTPTFIDDFSLSIDYFDIDLEDGITRFGAYTTAAMCVDASSIDNVFCPQVTRKADGNISNINDTYVNANKMRRRGLDIQSYYQQSLNEYGEIDYSLYVTHLLESSFTESDLAGADKREWVGVNGTPEWKASFIVAYTLEALRVSWQTNYSSDVLYAREATAEDYERFNIPSSVLHNLRVGYDLSEQTNIYFGINNVTDKDWLGTPGASRGGSTYPIAGRGYFAGVNVSF
ncbi:TonB-dependent receptor plug domain-containing protein [Thalassotalea fusca]